ncbi:MAG: UDP-N-acetylmuramate dehydrogenase [Candidatus Syntrophosphaera sp.]
MEKGVIRFGEPLSKHCSFKIGGPAEVFFTPESISQLIDILDFTILNKINYFILGRGSNLLISDKGVEGLIIHTTGLNKISRDENYISAYCGTKLRKLCEYARDGGLAGLEFASGIPGSVGGAVFMNAGAYDGEIKDILHCSKYLVPELKQLRSSDPVRHLKSAEHEFSYRSSIFQKRNFIHLSSVFRLREDGPERINERMLELERRRWDKQPMDVPSGGSVFRRPEGHFTGKLIDDCGLRGYRIGDAAVSDKHCGFIVNLGAATAADVLRVIRHVQKSVFERFGVKLETELRFLGKE